MLCSNRFTLPGSPTTCTIDSAIIPIPSFLLLIGLTIVYSIRKSHKAILTLRWLHITYMVLIVAAFGMTVLEIARLVAAHLGVGILPITPIALLAVFFVLWQQKRERSRAVSFLFFGYWILLAIAEIIKVARLHQLEELFPAKGSNYPSSDQFLDNAVMLGLWIVFAGIEMTTLILRRHYYVNTYDV